MRNNNSSNNWLEPLDVLAVISFIIGWFNFIENVDQTAVQDVVQKAVDDIHEHLLSQDEKIDKIINMLGGEVGEG